MPKSVERGPLPGDESLWDASDVARYLKVSRSWVYHQAESGTLPHRRVGALLRFIPTAIRAFALGAPTNVSHRSIALEAPNKRPSS